MLRLGFSNKDLGLCAMPEFEFEGKRPRVHPEAWVAPTAVEDGAVVGIGSVMLQRTRLGERAMLAAGSVLPEGREVPAGHLAAGSPAEVKKELSGSSADWVERTARQYQEAGVAYRESLVGVDRD